MKYVVFFTFFASLCACSGSTKAEPAPKPVDPNLPKLYWHGSHTDVRPTPLPGFVLAGGGTDNNNAMTWFLQRANGGDIVVLRSSGSDGYNSYFFADLGVKVNSVVSAVITSRTEANSDSLATIIRGAEALFIAGGDQWNYIQYWRGTKVEEAIAYLINTKKVTIGGTSAGMAVLSEFCYTAQNGSATSAEALANPYHAHITIDKSFIQAPVLKGVITDMHYAQRTREGRHVAFMARILKDFSQANVKGIACDEKTAVCVDENGIGYVFGGDAYFLSNHGSAPEVCASGEKLTWNNSGEAITTYVIPGDTAGTNRFNLTTWAPVKGGKKEHWYVVDGVFKRSSE